MNEKQVDRLKHSTCYLTEVMDAQLEWMEESGMSKRDIGKVNEAIDILFKLNQKYVKMEKNNE